MNKINDLISTCKSSYPPSQYIWIDEKEKPDCPSHSILEKLAINYDGFWKLEYKQEWGHQGFIFEEESRWRYTDVKQSKPEEVAKEYPWLSGKSFQKYLKKALKRKMRDNKWEQKYGISPEDEPEDKIVTLIPNYLLELVSFPFVSLSELYRGAYKSYTQNK